MSEYKDYGYSSGDFNHVHRYILSPLFDLLQQRKERIILDLGCGNGWLANLLIKKDYDVYGTDASVSGINIARKQNPSRFFVQDLSQDELPGGLLGKRFNTIISTEVIEHLYSPREYLNFCKKILLESGGGELILTTPYHGYLKNLALALSGNMDKHFTVLWDGGHIKFWSKETLSSVLNEAGFKDIVFRGCGRMPYLWKSMMISSKITP